MAHNILSLYEDRFDARASLGGCLINVNGETCDCILEKDSENMRSPTYLVKEKGTGRKLCTFRPNHLSGGPLWYQIEGASEHGGDATLMIPEHGMLSKADCDFGDDEGQDT